LSKNWQKQTVQAEPAEDEFLINEAGVGRWKPANAHGRSRGRGGFAGSLNGKSEGKVMIWKRDNGGWEMDL